MDSSGGEASAAGGGNVACAAWIRRRDEKAAAARVFVAYGRTGAAGSPPALEVLGFDAKECALSPEPLARAVLGEGGAGDAPRGIAVHPAGDELVCATAKGCRLFKLLFEEFSVRIIPRDTPSLESVGPQKCLAFSTDGAKFAIGGEVQICIILISEFCGVLNFLFLLLHSYCLLYMPQMFLTTLLHLKSFFHACFGDYFF